MFSILEFVFDAFTLHFYYLIHIGIHQYFELPIYVVIPPRGFLLVCAVFKLMLVSLLIIYMHILYRHACGFL